LVHSLDLFDCESVDPKVPGKGVSLLPKRESRTVPVLLNSSCTVPLLGYNLELSTRFAFNGWGPSSFSSELEQFHWGQDTSGRYERTG